MINGLWLYWAKEGRGLERSSDSIQYYLGLFLMLPKDNEQDAVGIDAFLVAMLVFPFRTCGFFGMKTNSIKTWSVFQAKTQSRRPSTSSCPVPSSLAAHFPIEPVPFAWAQQRARLLNGKG